MRPMMDSVDKNMLYRFNNGIYRKYLPVAQSGCRQFAFQGGRRSGKTFFICQLLLNRAFRHGEVVNMASMTSEQGRLGAYADCCTILANSPDVEPYVEILRSPREIRFAYNGGKLFFNSYQDPERAKGIACDWLYINEANNFSLQQYIDLTASVRKGVFIDFNPNTHFWAEDMFSEGQTIRSTWKDNEHLTEQQRQWFESLHERAHRDGATDMDVWLYRVYYLGEYAELQGAIFNASNLHRCAAADVPHLDVIVIFSDPSARVGNDYHANVMAGLNRESGKMYVLRTYSTNTDTDLELIAMLKRWKESQDRVRLYIETNGLGSGFYEDVRKSGIQAIPYASKHKKEVRILANYQTITDKVLFVEHDGLDDYLTQVYEFDGQGKCEHDDNIDAINSAISILKSFVR